MRYISGVLLSAFVLWGLPASQGYTQGLHSFCEGARSKVSGEVNLREAIVAIFGTLTYGNRGDECIYPQELIRYGDADVLLTIGNEPGQSCHGCAAKLSAYVLRRTPSGARVAARFIDFEEVGTFGDPGRISPVQIGGHDGFIIESGGTFQGYSSTQIRAYMFNAGRLIHLQPAISLSASNEGAMTNRRQVVSVEGSWRIANATPDEIVINYRVTTRGHTTNSQTVWQVRGSQLVLKSGRIPRELKEIAD